MISDGSFSSNDAETATARNEMIFKRPNNLVPLPKRAPSASQPKRSAGRIKILLIISQSRNFFLTLRRKRCPLFADGKQDDDAEKSDRENAAESGVAQSRYITEIGSN